jgi:phosphatidylglycerol:prolipoprotein diacylglycerol transferase
MAVQAPGLILLIGLWLGLVLAERLAPRFRANPVQVYNLVFVALITGIIGARIGFVLQNFEVFRQSLLNLFSLNPGLFDSSFGVFVGLISALLYGYRKNVEWWPMLDAMTPFFCVMMIAFGLSNLASGDAFGSETSLPWGIDLWGAVRHPTQIYQIIAGLFILGSIWPRLVNTSAIQRVPGETFFGFLALSAGAWLFVEAFRGDSVVLPNGIRLHQIGAWLVLAGSLIGFGKLHQQDQA